MADIDAKVNMSLDDIIKMEKKKKTNLKTKRGGIVKGGTVRSGTIRGGMRNANGPNMRGNVRGRNNNRSNKNTNQVFNKQGQWKKYPQKTVHGGFVKKRFNNNISKSNLSRSRSNLSLNKINVNNSKSIRRGFPLHQGGKFGLTPNKSRTNLAFTKPTFQAKNKGKGFLKRTNSMPNLRDPTSVYNRLGYQNPAQVAYRNRVKRAKNVSLQRHNKALQMQNAFSLLPSGNLNNMSLSQKKQSSGRRYSTGSLRSDQMMRAQRRAQYEHKLMRIGAARANNSVAASLMKAAYDANRRHPAMALYPMQTNSVVLTPRPLQRGRSPFKPNLQSLKPVNKTQVGRSASYMQRQQKRARSRSRSRSRVNNINFTDIGDLEDRSFSEVMYSLSNKFGVTGRTLNDRFSLF